MIGPYDSSAHHGVEPFVLQHHLQALFPKPGWTQLPAAGPTLAAHFKDIRVIRGNIQ